MKSKEPACGGVPVGFFGEDDFVGAELFSVVDLVGRGGELDGVGSEGVGEFEGHVAESAEADDADLFAGACAPVLERRVGGDSGAEQWRGGGEVEVGGNVEGEGLVEDDVVAVAAEGEFAVLVPGVVGPDGGVTIAVLLARRLCRSRTRGRSRP